MYRVEIHTTESGSAVRIVNTKTAEYVLVGSFEGIQRYASRNKIKWGKLAVICLCSRFEVASAVSSVLTQSMHSSSQHTATYIASKNTAQSVFLLGMFIGNMDFFDTYCPKSSLYPHIDLQEVEGISYLAVPLPVKKGGFDLKKAHSCSIVEKAHVILLNKTGEVTIENTTHLLKHFQKPAVVYPKILVVTILAAQYAFCPLAVANVLDSSPAGVEIFIRAISEAFKNKKEEHKALAHVSKIVGKLIDTHTHLAAGKGVQLKPSEVYTILNTEEETEAVRAFYDRICPIYAPVLRPLVYQPRYTKYLRNCRVLTNMSSIDYLADRKRVCREWVRNKKASSCSTPPSILHEMPGVVLCAKKERLLLDAQPMNAPYTVFLGTAAAVPGVIRNVSSVLMASSNGGVLLDCGEDTHTQLCKISKGYVYNYRSLFMLLLSHKHADHILGCFSVLQRCCLAGNRTVLVFGNSSMVSALELLGISCIFIQNSQDLVVKTYRAGATEYIQVNEGNKTIIISIAKSCKKDASKNKILNPFCYDVSSSGAKTKLVNICVSLLDTAVKFINLRAKCTPEISEIPLPASLVYEVSMCSARHIQESYSMKVKEYFSNAAPYTIVYSGDTLPNKKFAQLGHGADLMIHEGTFEEKDACYAKATKHSTISEALEIFKESCAHILYVTHFSQRYKTVPMPEDAYLAMDYMVHTPKSTHSQANLHKSLQEWANASGANS